MKDDYTLSGAPGQYRPLRADQRFSKAYFPDRLPPRISLSESVTEELASAMHALGRLDGLGSEVDNASTVFSAFVYKEAESSSQVEGTAVTVSDIYRSELDTGSPRGLDDDERRDIREARNYVRALGEAADYLTTAGREFDSVTVQLLKDLHERLMEDGRTDEEDPRPGAFRPGYVCIEEEAEYGFGSQVRFVPPKPEMVEGLMDDLVSYIKSGGEYPSLIDIAFCHYQFETVHPFVDGNGRVGRLLIVLLLMCSDLLVTPMLYLSSYINQNRQEYVDRLLAVSEEGEWDEWLSFFLRAIKTQAEEAFARARLLLRTREAYEERYRGSGESVRLLVPHLFDRPYITVNEARDRIDMTYQSANNAVETLVDDGVLDEITGNQQYRVFEAVEIMDIIERPSSEVPDPEQTVSVDNLGAVTNHSYE